MRRISLAIAAVAVVLAGGSMVAATFDPAQAQRRDRYDRRIEIHNRTGVTIREVYSTNVGRDDWGADLLGAEVIPPGRMMMITVEDNTGYCRYDFKAVLETGRQVQVRGLNVCEALEWVVR
jgi:hypothetical protein